MVYFTPVLFVPGEQVLFWLHQGKNTTSIVFEVLNQEKRKKKKMENGEKKREK